eukprot:5933_1
MGAIDSTGNTDSPNDSIAATTFTDLPVPVYIEPSNFPNNRLRHALTHPYNGFYNSLLYNDQYQDSSSFEADSSFKLEKVGDFWRFHREICGGHPNCGTFISHNADTYLPHNDDLDYRFRMSAKYTKAEFNIIDALNGREGYVSLQMRHFPQYYLRHRNGEVLLDLQKYDDDYSDDASFKIRCKSDDVCPVSHYRFLTVPDGGYLPMECYRDPSYVNGWDSYHDNYRHGYLPSDVNGWDSYHDNYRHGYFVAGMDSVHHNHYEDRLFKWKYCRVPDQILYGATSTLVETQYDEHFTRSCSNVYGLMVGGKSMHHNFYEDRRWTFYCADDINHKRYTFPNCGWTDWVNGYDAPVNFECPDNGVIRGIESVHNNYYEDRLWKFECCNIGLNLGFGHLKGFWTSVDKCSGCWNGFAISLGVENSQTDSSTSEYSRQFAMAVERGFEFEGLRVSATSGFAVATSKTLEISETYKMKTHIKTIVCNRAHVYQWQMSADEDSRTGGWSSIQKIKFKANYYLCSNSASPRCAPGFCVDSECQSCTGGFSAAARIGVMNILEDEVAIFNPGVPNRVFLMVVVIAILSFINFVCCAFSWFIRKRQRNGDFKYKKVSIQSSADEVSDLEAV